MDVFEISLQAINQNAKQLETVSQNVANINTSGYLAQVPFAQYVDEQGQTVTKNLLSTQGGTIRETERNLDVAVLDGGFFQVELGNQQYITRGGHFHIDSDGYLKHATGAFVLGEGGRINLPSNEVLFNGDGSVAVQGSVIDKLAIAKPKSSTSLTAVGNGLYQAPPSSLEMLSGRVTQKALNSANVNPSEEMVRMIEISRHLQTMQKMVNAYDQLLNVGINELGKK